MTPPDLSAVLVVPDTFATIRRTVSHLADQTVADRIELVIVCPDRQALELDHEAVAPLHSVTVVERAGLTTVAEGNAAGTRAAGAEIVVFCEDHSFPEPEWAAALLRRHGDGRWQVVGPVVLNGNPDSAVSWADYLVGYGPWAPPSRAGPVDLLPGHNSSYRRAVLLGLGDALEEALAVEAVLHWRLNDAGKASEAGEASESRVCFLEPEARTHHLNFGLWRSWLPALYHGGRIFAARRAERWSSPTRLAWMGGALFIPAVRLARVVRQALAPGRSRSRLIRCLPHLCLGLAMDGLGQLVGYAAGAGRSPDRLAGLEFHRVRHLRRPIGSAATPARETGAGP